MPIAWLTLQLDPVWAGALLAGLFVVGIPICGAAARWARVDDPGWVVYDELVTVPVACWYTGGNIGITLWAGFALHRLFDISKPPPVRQFERLPGGLGIMADDLMAALYANAVLRLGMWIWTEYLA